MKIAFVIPTYNRSNKIQKCIDSILDFRKSQEIEIHIIVCNNMSTDGTEAILENYSTKPNFIFYSREKFETSGHESLIKLLEELPINYDWYWIIGDDDYINIRNHTLFNSIFNSKELDYIHASSIHEGRSDQIFIGSGADLTEKYGLIGLYGFISSQIISLTTLIAIKEKLKNYKLSKEYCFSHALLFYQVLLTKKGAIISDDWIRNVDDKPSDGSGEPWLETAKYLKEAHDHGILKIPLSRGFLISEKKLLWRNFICWTILHSFSSKKPIDASKTLQIQETIKLCEDTELASRELHLFKIICEELNYIHSSTTKEDPIKDSILQNLTNIYNNLNQPCI